VHLVGFIICIYHDARSSECQIHNFALTTVLKKRQWTFPSNQPIFATLNLSIIMNEHDLSLVNRSLLAFKHACTYWWNCKVTEWYTGYYLHYNVVHRLLVINIMICFPTFLPWRYTSNSFPYSEDPLQTKIFTGKGMLIVENQLNYCSITVPNIYLYSCYIHKLAYTVRKKLKHFSYLLWETFGIFHSISEFQNLYVFMPWFLKEPWLGHTALHS